MYRGGTLQKSKGFTLIELLAVIVILAIIALIATPIVLNIISDSRNSSQLRSADFYLDAVEYAVSQSIIDKKAVENGTYNIIEDGNICLKYKSDKVECIDILKAEVSGEVPTEGSTITVIDGQIKNINLKYDTSTIMKNIKGELAFFENEYKLSAEIVFDPGDQDRTWNVIDEDIDTVTLMLNENLGETVAWYEPQKNNTYGPLNAFYYLNTLTIEWENVDPIESYVYINNKDGNAMPYGYQKLEINDGITKITNQDGTKVNEIPGETKARLITIEEVIKIGKQFNKNLTEENLLKYMERNLSTINSKLSTSFKTVNEAVISFSIANNIQYDSKYMQLYLITRGGISEYDIEPTYNISLPSFMYQTLNPDSRPIGYWTLSTQPEISSAILIDNEGFFYSYLTWGESNGVRPVITISKTKLN